MELQESDLAAETPPKIKRARETHPINELLLEVGLDEKEIGPEIVGRMKLLDELTDFIDDELKAIEFSRAVFEFCERAGRSFSDAEKKIVRTGMLFSDIGKTGPKKATKKQQQLIVEIFAVEGVRDTKMPVKNFFVRYFPEDAEKRTRTLEELGLDSSTPMRDFWNLHVLWTLEIISGDGVPEEAVAAAATHQLLEGINPDDIVGTDGRFTRYFGNNTSFDRAEKLLILLDKYEAFRRRLGKTHGEAIARTREIIAQNERSAGDEEFAVLLKDMEDALAD